MAIDAAAAVPSAVGLVAVVHPYRQKIVARGVKVGRELVSNAAVSVWARAQGVAVQVDGGTHIHAIEVDEIAFASLNA